MENPIALQKKRAIQLFYLLSGGLDDDEARDVLELTPVLYRRLKEKMFLWEAERVRGKTTDRVYLEYVIEQRACIAELTEISRRFDKAGHYNAALGAIRTRSDILDKIIKLGQEFAILEKRPEEKRVIAGVVVAQLSDVQLKQAITVELAGLNKLVEAYGEGKILDMKPGALHYALPESTKKPTKTNRAKANRTHGGRRVVKQKVLE